MSTDDPRYKHKNWLTQYLDDTELTYDDDETELTYVILFSGFTYPLEREFLDYANDVLIIVSNVETFQHSTHGHYPFAYDEQITLQICSITQYNRTTTIMNEKFEQQIRKISAEHPFGSVRSITSIQNSPIDLAGLVMHSRTVTIRYRIEDPDYAQTTPSITHAHGDLNECDTTTGYTKTDDGNTSTFTIDDDKHFKLQVTVCAGNEETKVVNNGDIDKSTTLYTQIKFRYKTDNANIKAKIIAVFDDLDEQVILADTSSLTYAVGTVTLTPGKTLDHIELYADHAQGIVLYDYTLVCKGTFVFPNTLNMEFHPAPPRTAILGPPGRSGDITQGLATKSGFVKMTCLLDVGTWKRTNPADTKDGEVFVDIAHNSKDELWQWLNIGTAQFKVTMEDPVFRKSGSDNVVDLTFREYAHGSKENESHVERYGMDL